MAESNPAKFNSLFVKLDDVDIHLVHNGTQNLDGTLDPGSRQILLLLHGFPEYHGAWDDVMPLLAENYLVIAPDQRGYNLSSAPQDVSSYQAKLLVADMTRLMERLVPGSRYHLVGHDWGASVAYAMAMRLPECVNTLNIINGVHPITFQRALAANKDQIKASQYFHILCADGAEKKMSENAFARTFSMLEKFSSSPWLDQATRQKYLEAWSQPGRINAMVNWYRASPMVVPHSKKSEKGEESPANAPLLDVDPAKFNISMPHLVIWGMQDTALLPVARAGLEEFAGDLTIVEVEVAGHWINHTHPGLVAGKIHKFVAEHL
ncbi:MAG: alpha/beta hydrolase [Hyphomicrobiales bacterium]|nr:alpha/beta hydrolase [Hyphomicrobiales bacterium]